MKARQRPPRRRGRNVNRQISPGAHWSLINYDPALTGPIIGWTVFLLVIGIGPLLILELLNLEGLSARILAVLGPMLIGLGFTGLIYGYGMHYAPRLGWSRRRVYLLTALFMFMTVLGSWGLWVSV